MKTKQTIFCTFAVILAFALTITFTALSLTGCSGGGGKSLNSAEALKEYIDKQPANSPDKPIRVAMKANEMMIGSIVEVIKNAGKYVSLNLSGSPLTTIPEEVFEECVTLVGIIIPNGVTNIGERAFSGCTNLTSVTIGNSVTNIEYGAFRGCTNLAGITIPNSVTSIGNSAFYGCTNLASVTIGSGVTSIGNGAFYDCTNLASVTIPNSVTSIGNSAFYGCTNLASVTIGNGVTSIENKTFEDCENLNRVTIGSGVTSIADSAFSNCTSLTAINVDSGNSAFISENGVLYNKDKTTLVLYPEGKTDTTFTIPNNVTLIWNGAFRSNTSLTSINIASVTDIGDNKFYGLINLASITVDADNSSYASEGGILYDNTKAVLLRAPRAISGDVSIPESVVFIAEDAFSGCTGLTGVTFAPNIQLLAIGDRAFSDCTSLASITIPAGIYGIGNYAFSNCTSITEITIPVSVTSVGRRAFNDWTSSQIIGLPGKATWEAADKTWGYNEWNYLFSDNSWRSGSQARGRFTR